MQRTGETTLQSRDSPLDTQAEALQEAFSALVRLYQFRDRDRICCHDISVTQCYALESLVRSDPMSLNQLAGELYLDKSTACRVVSALERKGYVARERDAADGRAVSLKPTRAGRRLYASIREQLVDEKRKLIADLEPGVCEETTRLLVRLTRAVAARVSGDPESGGCARAGDSECG